MQLRVFFAISSKISHSLHLFLENRYLMVSALQKRAFIRDQMYVYVSLYILLFLTLDSQVIKAGSHFSERIACASDQNRFCLHNINTILSAAVCALPCPALT